MNKITNKVIKQIKGGDHAVLMKAIEFLLDVYNEDAFDLGYESCLADMTVHSQRLAEHIAKSVDEPYTPEDIKKEELEKVINEYFKHLM